MTAGAANRDCRRRWLRPCDLSHRSRAASPRNLLFSTFLQPLRVGELLLGAVGVAVRALTSARVALAPATVPATQAAERMSNRKAQSSDVDALELGLCVYLLVMLIGLAIAIEDVAAKPQTPASGATHFW